jgi:hypothetical protein
MPEEQEPQHGDVFVIEDIDPEDWQCRQVYAKFGLAMFQGQALEHEIVNLILWTGVSAGTIGSRQDFDTANAELFRKTMGAIKTVLMSRRIDLGHLEEKLIQAVSLRNFLAHRYFRERAAAFMNREGRDQMIAELERAVEFFEQVDARLTPFTLKIIESFGLLGEMPEVMKESEATMGFGEPLPGPS